MRLSDSDNELFILTQQALFNYVIKTTRVVKIKKPLDYRHSHVDMETLWKLTQHIFDHPDLIDAFARENPAQMGQEQLDLAASWTRFVYGKFCVVKDFKKYTVFMEMKEAPKLYGVVGLFKEIRDMTSSPLPAMVETYLIPFQDKIVHCGFFHAFQVSFGPGIRKTLLADYRKYKQSRGIITQL